MHSNASVAQSAPEIEAKQEEYRNRTRELEKKRQRIAVKGCNPGN